MANQGKPLIGGILFLALAASIFAWWWNLASSRLCGDFWGSAAARRISGAPKVDLLILGELYDAPPEADVIDIDGERYGILSQYDVSAARGISNIRWLLVKDASFDWNAGPQQPPARWPLALRFSDSQEESTVLLSSGAELASLIGKRAAVSLQEPAAKLLMGFIVEHHAAAGSLSQTQPDTTAQSPSAEGSPVATPAPPAQATPPGGASAPAAADKRPGYDELEAELPEEMFPRKPAATISGDAKGGPSHLSRLCAFARRLFGAVCDRRQSADSSRTGERQSL